MTLDQLVLLQKTHQLGSVRAVSEALCKTPSAVSQSLKLLEQQLSLSLFDRSGYRLKLTQEGIRVCQQAEQALKEIDKLKALSEHMRQGYESDIQLSFDGAYDIRRFKSALQAIQKDYPLTRIHLHQEYLSGAVEAIQSQRVELAISPTLLALFHENSIEHKVIAEQQLINVASAELLCQLDHPRHSAQLKQAYQVVVRDSGSMTKEQEYGVQDGQKKWYVNDYETKKNLILTGLGWGKLPDHLIQNEIHSGELIELKLEDLPSRLDVSYCLLRKKAVLLGKVGQTLWDMFP